MTGPWVRDRHEVVRVAGREPSRIRGDTGTGEMPLLHLVGPDSYADWEAIYRDNVERVYRLMFRRVGNRSDAEDLTTEVVPASCPPVPPTAATPRTSPPRCSSPPSARCVPPRASARCAPTC